MYVRTSAQWVQVLIYFRAATPDTFGVVYSAAIRSISSKDYGFMLGFDDVKRHDIDRALMDGTVFPEGYIDDFTKFYTDTIDGLIRENSWPQTGTVRNLDFVRDCSTMASVYWVARTFGIPLKLNKKGYEHGLLTPQELYLMLTGASSAIGDHSAHLTRGPQACLSTCSYCR